MMCIGILIALLNSLKLQNIFDMTTLNYCLLLVLSMLVNPEMQLYSTKANMGDTTVSGVGLGRKKKNCKGKGVCIIGSDIKSIDDRHTIAKLSFTGQSLSSMFISYSDLSEKARRQYFSEKYFIMEEAYVGDLRANGKLYKINITKGKYPISTGKNGLKIEFE